MNTVHPEGGVRGELLVRFHGSSPCVVLAWWRDERSGGFLTQKGFWTCTPAVALTSCSGQRLSTDVQGFKYLGPVAGRVTRVTILNNIKCIYLPVIPRFIAENGRVEQVHGRASGGGGVRWGKRSPSRPGSRQRDFQWTDRPAGPDSRPRREPEGCLPVEDRPFWRHQQLNRHLVVVLWTTSIHAIYLHMLH